MTEKLKEICLILQDFLEEQQKFARSLLTPSLTKVINGQTIQL